MKIKYLLALAMILILSGCASVGDSQQGKIKRITSEELNQLLPPPIATFTLEDIVADTRQGKVPNEIINKIQESSSRYELSSSQILDLSAKGVDTEVLDYIQNSNALAKQNAIADEMNRRQKDAATVKKQLRRERLSRHRYYDPFYSPRYRFFYRHRIPIGAYGRHRRGHHFGFGTSFGYPYGW